MKLKTFVGKMKPKTMKPKLLGKLNLKLAEKWNQKLAGKGNHQLLGK